ncbi:MAG: long-chain-acyl-CoA synthetase, partial [Methylorubrum rhodinum]
GRAGMAALTVGPGFDLARLHAELAERLPAYARPLFVRLTEELGHTETFKQKKAALAEEGFDPARTADPLYLDRDGAYRRIDRDLYEAISSECLRL